MSGGLTLDAAMRMLQISEANNALALAEVTKVQGEKRQLALRVEALTEALQWYLGEDQESVKHGVLEAVETRPAAKLLAGQDFKIFDRLQCLAAIQMKARTARNAIEFAEEVSRLLNTLPPGV